MKHKQEAAGPSFREAVRQPLQCRGSVTKHETAEEDQAFFCLPSFFDRETILHEYKR